MARERRSPFHTRLASLGFSSYHAYLRSDHWSEVRRAFWDAKSGCRCWCCDRRATELHHPRYETLGCETADDLIAVCSRCHKAIHTLNRDSGISLRHAHEERRARLRGVTLPDTRKPGKRRRRKRKKPAPVPLELEGALDRRLRAIDDRIMRGRP